MTLKETISGLKSVDQLLDPSPRRLTKLDALKLFVIFGLSALLLLIHYVTPTQPQWMLLHSIHRHLLYVPIVMAACWYGLRGGLAAGGLIFAVYFPHIAGVPYPDDAMMQAMSGPVPDAMQGWSNFNHILECSNYLLIGGLTGYLIDRLRAEESRLKAALGRLRDSAGELFRSEEQLRRADRMTALGQLSAGLAHEIRNPLGSIRGAAEILCDSETAPAQRAEFGQVLVEETHRLDEALRGFLDYARNERNDSGGPANPRRAFDRLLLLLDQKLKMGRISVRLNVAENLPALAISESLLQQVLLNIVLNAIQAMPEGGQLAIDAAPDPFPGEERGNVKIAIADSGSGIPLEIRERVFDPFFTTKDTGSGLGLSIVHKIVTSQGGEVSVDGEFTSGTRILVRLPAA